MRNHKLYFRSPFLILLISIFLSCQSSKDSIATKDDFNVIQAKDSLNPVHLKSSIYYPDMVAELGADHPMVTTMDDQFERYLAMEMILADGTRLIKPELALLDYYEEIIRNYTLGNTDGSIETFAMRFSDSNVTKPTPSNLNRFKSIYEFPDGSEYIKTTSTNEKNMLIEKNTIINPDGTTYLNVITIKNNRDESSSIIHRSESDKKTTNQAIKFYNEQQLR
ncbi:hypothetical protein [Zhouia amylolytica]|nr:hypothetical protein [Zhouia amylolytica]